MFDHRHYVPVLKWKQGEYQALHRLTNPVKDALTPLIEIQPVGWDFESEQDRETVDDHLGDFGKRLKQKWQTRRCFVDLKLIDPTTCMAGGGHCITALFHDARTHGCTAIPVVSVTSDAACRAAVASVVSTDRRGACVRLKFAELDRPNLAGDIATLLAAVGVSYPDADLVLDLGASNFTPISVFARTLLTAVTMIPAIARWRTFTIAGASYPETHSQITPPFALVPRQDWLAYKALVGLLPTNVRIPTFGDYAVSYPELVSLDPRKIKPFAKVRYTIEDRWHIGRGTPTRTHGFGQYQTMCQTLVAQPYFDGTGFSAGDTYIADCATGTASTGSMTTWVWVSTNRHLTRVVADLATFHGLSVAAE